MLRSGGRGLGVLLFLLAVQEVAVAQTRFGCFPEGGSATSQSECASIIPRPWDYVACDEAPPLVFRERDWCLAFGGTGDAQVCSDPETFTRENLVPVAQNFEHLVHGCESPSLSDSGWGQTVTSNFCFTGAPAWTSHILYGDYRELVFSGHTGQNCATAWSETVTAKRVRGLTCPAGYAPEFYGGDNNHCSRSAVCPCHYAGNPTRVADGQKIETPVDVAPIAGGLLQYKRTYRSDGPFKPYQSAAIVALEPFWTSNFDTRLYVLDTATYAVPYVVATPDGTVRYFDRGGAEYVHYGRAAERLVVQQDATGRVTGYARTLSDDSVETYTADGLLAGYSDTQGHAVALAYDASRHLASVTDERGRQLRFEYDADGRRTALNLDDGSRFAYAYDANDNLASVTNPDGSIRRYRYGDSNWPHALTGITDENGADFAAFTYDSAGRIADSRHAPALANGSVDHFHFDYGYSSTLLTEPLGQSVTYAFTLAAGVKNLASMSAPCGGCGESYAAVQYDPAGYFASARDFNGNLTTFVYDDARGLETARTEASGTPAQRTTTTLPDPQFRKPALRTVSSVSGPESRSAWQYNARGQVIARCESDPNDAAAAGYRCSPDIAPPSGAAVRRWIYRYCETSDVAAGSCPLVGLLLSSDGPRTDVADVTTYAYYATTDRSGCGVRGAPCHAVGDLKTVTNALGQTTTYVGYDPLGRMTRIQDANGVLTDLTYHARGWLVARTVRADANGTPDALDATTRFDYDGVGNVTRVTQPDGTYLHYAYDAAHRLTDVYDSATPSDYRRGDHLQYTLDAAGNRIDEKTVDPNGSLTRELSRTYDQLNRLTALLNSHNVAVQAFVNPAEATGSAYSDGYDGNGNAIYSIDGGVNRVGTEQQVDPLNRLVKSLQDHAGTGNTRDTTTRYAYDARDNLRSVTDPDGLVTRYTYDGLNRLTDLTSPDTGHAGYSYDAAGNRTRQTDARGVSSTFEYDALNRLIAIRYPTSALDIAYAYDEPAPGCFNAGRLTSMSDSSGSTQFCYDGRGNISSKTQRTNETRSCATKEAGCTAPPTGAPAGANATLTASVPFVVSYAYTLSDRVAAITYSSGAVVSYGRDSAGRINRVAYQAKVGATSVPVLSDVSYYPFGPANRLTFGNGRTLTKTYDTDYAIRSVASSAGDGLAIDAQVDPLGNLTAASDKLGAAPTQRYAYDALYRLTEVDDASGTPVLGLTYGPTGDRLSKTTASQPPQVYTYALGTHHLASVAGVPRRYDANGNTLTGGLSYDDRNRLSGWNLTNGQINLAANSARYDYNARGERVSKQTMHSVDCPVPNCRTLSGVPAGWQTGTEAFVYDEAGRLPRRISRPVFHRRRNGLPLSRRRTHRHRARRSGVLHRERPAGDAAGCGQAGGVKRDGCCGVEMGLLRQ